MKLEVRFHLRRCIFAVVRLSRSNTALAIIQPSHLRRFVYSTSYNVIHLFLVIASLSVTAFVQYAHLTTPETTRSCHIRAIRHPWALLSAFMDLVVHF